ncbi:uncharacterized protein LOC141900515 [Tubulanus polymorphus]|uniref:uncharacterized protein LOC141900515 n=1 Tax=Tubulanus polymorphus TaxID=672921 RepID=UPI003DA5E764
MAPPRRFIKIIKQNKNKNMSTRSSPRFDRGPKTRLRSTSSGKESVSRTPPTKTRKLTFVEQFQDPPDIVRKYRRNIGGKSANFVAEAIKIEPSSSTSDISEETTVTVQSEKQSTVTNTEITNDHASNINSSQPCVKSCSPKKQRNKEPSPASPESPRTLRSHKTQRVMSLRSKGPIRNIQSCNELQKFKTVLSPIVSGVKSDDAKKLKVLQIPVKKLKLVGKVINKSRPGLFERFQETKNLALNENLISDPQMNIDHNPCETVDIARTSSAVCNENTKDTEHIDVITDYNIMTDFKEDAIVIRAQLPVSGAKKDEGNVSIDESVSKTTCDETIVKNIVDDMCNTVCVNESADTDDSAEIQTVQSHVSGCDNSDDIFTNNDDKCANVAVPVNCQVLEKCVPVSKKDKVDSTSIMDVEKRIDEIQALVCDIKKEISISNKSAKRRRSSDSLSNHETDEIPYKKRLKSLNCESEHATKNLADEDIQLVQCNSLKNVEVAQYSGNRPRRTHRPPPKLEYMMYMCDLNNGKRQKLNKSPFDYMEKEKPTKKSNIKKMLKSCKPCSVVMVDFVKSLNLNQQKYSENSEHETLPLKPKAPLPKLFHSISPSAEDEEVDILSVSPPPKRPIVCAVPPLSPHPHKKRGSKYYCNSCNYSTFYKLAMEDHVYIHLDVVPFKCGHCEGVFGTRSGNVAHHKRNHQNLPLKVIKRGNVVESDYYTCRQHSSPIAKARPVIDLVPSVSNAPNVRLSHCDSSHSSPVFPPPTNARFQCRYCTFSSSGQVTMETHFYTRHIDEHHYICPLCDLSFCRRSETMLKHFAKWHPGHKVILQRACGYYDFSKPEDRANYNQKSLNPKFNEQHFVRRDSDTGQMSPAVTSSPFENSTSSLSSLASNDSQSIVSEPGTNPQHSKPVTDFSMNSVTIVNYNADEDNDVILNLNDDSPTSLKILNVMSLQEEATVNESSMTSSACASSPTATSIETSPTPAPTSLETPTTPAPTAPTSSPGDTSTSNQTFIPESNYTTYICKHCAGGVKTSTLYGMTTHLEAAHSNLDFWYGCPYCPFGCSKHRINLMRHLKRAHPKEPINVDIHLIDEDVFIRCESQNRSSSTVSNSAQSGNNPANSANPANTPGENTENIVEISGTSQTRPPPPPIPNQMLRQRLATPVYSHPQQGNFPPRYPSAVHHYPMPMMPPHLMRPILPKEYEKYQVFNIKPPNVFVHHQQQQQPMFIPHYGYPMIPPQYGMQPGFYYPPNPPSVLQNPAIPQNPPPVAQNPTVPQNPPLVVQNPTIPQNPPPVVQNPTIPQNPPPVVQSPTIPQNPPPVVQNPTVPQNPPPVVQNPTIPQNPPPVVQNPTIPQNPPPV